MLCLFHVISEVVPELNYVQSSLANVNKQIPKNPISYFLPFDFWLSVLKNAQHFRFLSSDNAEYLIVCFCLLVYFFLAAPFCLWDLSSLTKESNLHPLHWKCRVLTTGSPGESQNFCFWSEYYLHIGAWEKAVDSGEWCKSSQNYNI